MAPTLFDITRHHNPLPVPIGIRGDCQPNQDRGEPRALPTASPEAVTRFGLPHKLAYGFPRLRSSETDLQHCECLQLPRHRSFRRRLSPESGAVKAFDGLITAGCCADLIVAGVTEIAQSANLHIRLSPEVRQQRRRQAQHLALALEDLAEVNATAAARWPSDLFPIFLRDLTKTLQGEAHRLNDLADTLDLRHYTGVRPHRITMFLAAVNHAKDVTGTYRDGKFAQMFEGLGVLSRGYPLSEETIKRWRLRGADAERYDPRRPWVDRLREVWT